MIPAWSYWTVFDALERKFEATRRVDRRWDITLTGLLFARPSSKLDTVEVCGTSPHGPTIHLTDSTRRRQVPHRPMSATRHHSSPIARGFPLPNVDAPGWVEYRPPKLWTSCCGLVVLAHLSEKPHRPAGA